MRNPERIKPFLNKIEEIWLQHSDLRFGQLILNIHRFSEFKNVDLFYIEDDDFEKLIDKRFKPVTESRTKTS